MNKIPAKVSETEIIIPPGVVSYYGVKFFEDLRGQAKQDFARMEAEGRVGGEPVDTNGMPMEQDEELTSEEMQMLAEALGQASTGMAMGGMVPQQQQAMYNPYEQQQTQYTQPQPMFQSTRTGMQEGGLAEEATKGYLGPIFDPSQYSYGGGFSSLFGGDTSTASSGGMEIIEYINPETGQTRMITVLNGKPIGLVPEGFIPASQEAKKKAQETKQEVETKTEGTRVRMGGDGPPEGFGQEPKGPSVDMDMKSGTTSINNNINQGKIGKSIGMGLAALSPFGGLLGMGIGKLSDKSTALQNMIDAVTAQELGLDDAEEAMSMAMDFARDIGLDDDQVSDMMGRARDTVSDTFSGGIEGAQGQDPMGDVGFTGDTRGTTGEALGRAGEAPGPGPSRGRSGGEGPSGPAGAAGTGPGPSQGGAGGPSSGGRSGGPSGPAGAAGTGAGPSQGGAGGPSSGGRSGGPSGPAGASGTAGVGGPSGDSDAGTPRAEGGLMGKPKGSQNKKRKPNQRKKPIKNRKGLASK